MSLKFDLNANISLCSSIRVHLLGKFEKNTYFVSIKRFESIFTKKRVLHLNTVYNKCGEQHQMNIFQPRKHQKHQTQSVFDIFD